MVASPTSPARTPTPARGTSAATPGAASRGGSSQRSGGAVQCLKNELQGQTFEEQESTLAPRESKKSEPEATPKVETIEQAMSRWAPVIKKVTDPVAFMTSGSDGNYTAGIYNPKSKGGFFEEAKAQIATLDTEIQAFAVGQTGEDKVGLLNVAAMLGAWSRMYGAIQNTGQTKEAAADPAARKPVYERVRALVDQAGTAFQAVLGSPVLDAAVVGSVGNAYDEISLFVDSWNDVSATSGQTSASPYMWGAFLQTIERYRSILNQYGKLEERAGDATGTAKLAVKDSDKKQGMVQDGERYEEVAEAKGGTMVLALESYNYRAANIVECQKQAAAMLARVEAGEFETAEQAVAAFRANIGAGLASEVFYKNVEQLARGAWHTQSGTELLAEGDADAKQAYKAYKLSEEASKASDASMGKAEKKYEAHEEKSEKMDYFGSEEAFEATMTHKRNAQLHAQEAQACANAGDTRLGDANKKYAEAETEIVNAEIALSKVDAEMFPQLAPGVSDVRGKVATLKGDLSESKENAAALEQVSQDIQARAKNAKKIAGDYKPEKHVVDCPAVGVEGAELEHFEKFSAWVSVSPMVWLTIKGGVSGEWGTTHKDGELKSFTEDKAHGSVIIDLWILEFEVGYETKTRFEVDGFALPQTVQDRGAEEKGKWESAKEVHESGAQEKLTSAFTNERKAMNAIYRSLGEAAAKRAEGGSKNAFAAEVDAAETQIDAAQFALYGAVMFNSGGSWWEGAKEADKLPDPEDLKTNARSLVDLPKAKAPFEVTKQGEAHEALMSDTQQQSTERFQELAGFTNNDSVSFKSTGTWSAGVKAGGGDLGFGYKYSRAASIGDGEGDTFDFEEKVAHVHEVSFESPVLDGSITLTLCDGDMELGADAEFKVDLGSEEEQAELQQGLKSDLQMLKELLTGGLDPSSLLQLGAKRIGEQIERRVKSMKPAYEEESEMKVSFGISLELKKSGAVSGEFSIGLSREVAVKGDAGVAAFDARWEGGMRVTVPLF